MSTITERLSVGKELRELKLGKTFKNISKSSSNSGFSSDTNTDAFHTIRYDFKPASVDTTKTATIDFGENNKVTVTAPNVDGSGLPHTVYKGSRKPHPKECVLIIDHTTGEIVLERLSQNIAVKKTRVEGSSKAQLQQRPITPSLEVNEKKSSPPLPASQPQQSSQNAHTASFVSGPMAKSISPKINDAFNGAKANKNSQFGSNLLGNPGRNSTVSNLAPSVQIPPTNRQPAKLDDDMVGVLSESSSDSSDNESSNSSDSDSDDESEKGDAVQNGDSRVVNRVGSVNNNGPIGEILPSDDDSSSGSESGSNSDSSEDEKEARKSPVRPTANGSALPSMPNVLTMSNMPNTASLPSMPKFSQLSQDLQLSESGSDSD